MNRFYRSLVWTGIVAAGLAGCGDDVTVVDPPPPPPPPPPSIQSVTVAPDGVQVSPNQQIQMTAAVTAGAGCNPAVTWSVSDATRASVSAAGLVTIAAAAQSGPVAVRASATCATGGATGNGVATLNVVGTVITSVTVTPSTATLNAGTATSAAQTLQASATVNGTNVTNSNVTWSSLDATIATVNATGLVTANSNGVGGPVNIRACSVADNTKCGFLALTVIVPSPATVQIRGITFVPSGGTGSIPVVLTNVFGQVEIELNIEPGSRTLTRVDALIGGQVVASQSFASGSAQAQAPEGAPTTVILSTNTAQLRQTGSSVLVPVIFNGNSAVTANLYVQQASQPIASNAIPVVMNNPDAVVRRRAPQVTGRSAALAPSSTSPSAANGGNTYFKGTQKVSGYDYVAFGRNVPTSVTLDSDVCEDSNNLITGTSETSGLTLDGLYDCGASVAPDGNQGGNDVVEVVTTTYAPTAQGPDGTPLTKPEESSCGEELSVLGAGRARAAALVSSSGVATVGTGFDVPTGPTGTEKRWNMFCPPVGAAPGPSYIDNLAPIVSVNAGAVSVGPAVAFRDDADQQWVNASYPFSQDISATDTQVGDIGSGLAAGFPQARDHTGACTSTVVTTGNDYSETATSIATDGKRICAYAEDRLGNARASGPSNYFGVDKTAPLVRALSSTAPAPAGTPYSGSTLTDTQIYSIASPPPAADVFGVEGLDGRSGFDQGASVLANFPATMSLTRFNALGTIACDMGPVTGLAFADPFSLFTILSDTYVRSNEVPILCAGGGLGGVGYYEFKGNVTDRAGNSATEIFREFAADHLLPPNITGIGFASTFYTPGAAGSFGFSANDDLEVIDATLALQQFIPTSGATYLRYPLGSLSPLGVRWDNQITNVINGALASVGYFLFRVDEVCTAAATPYASCTAVGTRGAALVGTTPPLNAPYYNAPVARVSADYTTAPLPTTNAGYLPTGVVANVADVASQLAAGTPLAPMLVTQFNPAAGISEQWVAGDLLSWWASNIAGVATAVHVSSTSITIPYFDNASLWRLNNLGEWVKCSTTFPAPVRTDNGQNRFHTYQGTIPTAATDACVDTAGGSFVGAAPIGAYRVMGTKNGAGLFTPNFN